MIIFGKVITTAKRIKETLGLAVKENRNSGALFLEIETIYNCRLFGLCIYPVRGK